MPRLHVWVNGLNSLEGAKYPSLVMIWAMMECISGMVVLLVACLEAQFMEEELILKVVLDGGGVLRFRVAWLALKLDGVN